MIEWTEAYTTAMLGYVSTVFSDLSGLLVPIIAVGVGLMVVGAIIKAVRG